MDWIKKIKNAWNVLFCGYEALPAGTTTLINEIYENTENPMNITEITARLTSTKTYLLGIGEKLAALRTELETLRDQVEGNDAVVAGLQVQIDKLTTEEAQVESLVNDVFSTKETVDAEDGFDPDVPPVEPVPPTE